MSQLLLIADPKPLVERLGPDFFRQAPTAPGVYLMRNAAGIVVYVGKAKNLRKRLGSYRVANPQRLKRRQLRLLRAVQRIEFEECPDEASALARESELLRELRPQFNRAGVWPGEPRFLCWRMANTGLELAVMPVAHPEWLWHGPMGSGAIHLHAALVRLLWAVLRPDRGLTGIPEGWFHGRFPGVVRIVQGATTADWEGATKQLRGLFLGQAAEFAQWIREQAERQDQPFLQSARETDLETVVKLCSRFGSTEDLPE